MFFLFKSTFVFSYLVRGVSLLRKHARGILGICFQEIFGEKILKVIIHSTLYFIYFVTIYSCIYIYRFFFLLFLFIFAQSVRVSWSDFALEISEHETVLFPVTIFKPLDQRIYLFYFFQPKVLIVTVHISHRPSLDKCPLIKTVPPIKFHGQGNISFFVVFTQKPSNMLVVSVLFFSLVFLTNFCKFVFFLPFVLFLFSKRIISDKHHCLLMNF